MKNHEKIGCKCKIKIVAKNFWADYFIGLLVFIEINLNLQSQKGGLAQLVERLHGMQ